MWLPAGPDPDEIALILGADKALLVAVREAPRRSPPGEARTEQGPGAVSCFLCVSRTKTQPGERGHVHTKHRKTNSMEALEQDRRGETFLEAAWYSVLFSSTVWPLHSDTCSTLSFSYWKKVSRTSRATLKARPSSWLQCLSGVDFPPVQHWHQQAKIKNCTQKSLKVDRCGSPTEFWTLEWRNWCCCRRCSETSLNRGQINVDLIW